MQREEEVEDLMEEVDMFEWEGKSVSVLLWVKFEEADRKGLSSRLLLSQKMTTYSSRFGLNVQDVGQMIADSIPVASALEAQPRLE